MCMQIAQGDGAADAREVFRNGARDIAAVIIIRSGFRDPLQHGSNALLHE